jgi:hypothetical protein
MNKQIERLNSAVDLNEENSGTVLRKCKAYEEQLSSVGESTSRREGEYERVVQVLARTLAPLLRNCSDLVTHKRILGHQLAKAESTLAVTYKAVGIQRQVRGVTRFRSVAFAVIAGLRLWKFNQPKLLRGGVIFNGVLPRMSCNEIPNFKLPTFANDFEILHSIIYSMESFIERPSSSLFTSCRALTPRNQVNLGQLF